MRIRKVLCVFSSVFLLVSFVIDVSFLDVSAQQTSQVHNLSKAEDYETIQQSIDAASVGDTIYVGNGTYYEHVVINKPVFLMGENKFSTIVDGGGSGNVISITADNVTVTGFTIQNGGLTLMMGGVYIDHSVNNELIGNIIRNSEYGVYLSYSSENSIVDNTVLSNSYGIGLTSSSDNVISNNNFLYNDHGISASASVNNVFSGNDVSSNSIEGVLLSACISNVFSSNRVSSNINGFHIVSSPNNNFFDNNVSMNEKGFFLTASSLNAISNNNIFLNNYGVVLGTSNTNLFSNNYILNNGHSFRIVVSCNNTIYHNSFINTLANTTQRPYGIELRVCVNFWDNKVEGNYWSTFNGSDENEDGIIDTPYIINKENKDNYPLMGPFMWFHIVMGAQSYIVNVLCNSTISDFKYLRYEDNRTNQLSFQVSGKAGNFFCRICIPHSLIAPPYTVIVNHNASLHSRIVYSNGTHSWLYCSYYCSEFKPAVISLSSLRQPVWLQLWFWAIIGLIMAIILLFIFIIRYHRTVNQQKKIIQAYKFELQKKANDHLKAAHDFFKNDVKRRKAKIKTFEKKYNLKIRPHGSLEEIVTAVKIKKDRKKNLN